MHRVTANAVADRPAETSAGANSRLHLRPGRTSPVRRTLSPEPLDRRVRLPPVGGLLRHGVAHVDDEPALRDGCEPRSGVLELRFGHGRDSRNSGRVAGAPTSIAIVAEGVVIRAEGDAAHPDAAFMVRRLRGYSPALAGRIVYRASFDALGY